MEVELGQLLQAPGEPVRERDRPARAGAQLLAGGRLTGKTDAAASSACAMSSVAAEGKMRKKGARTATIGWK